MQPLPPPPGPSATVLSEQLRAEQDTNLLLMEELTESAWGRLSESTTQLEQMLTGDVGWQQLAARANTEFSRTGLTQITAICRLMWIKNPLIRRGVNLRAHYVWGRGVTVSSDQQAVQDVIDRLFADPSTIRAVWGARAREDLERAACTDGNVIIACPTSRTGRVRLRTVDPDEVHDIIHDPDDPAVPWFYKRTWTQTIVDASNGARTQRTRTTWHPDIDHHPKVRPAQFAGHPIDWTTPYTHVRSGAPTSWTFGIPDVYPAIDWARAYTRFLEDWLAYVKSLARFAWQHKAKGRRVESVKAAHEATYEDRPDGRRTPAGRTLVGADDLQPITHTGAHVDADSGRPVVMMVSAALEVPYGWLTGDPDRGNLATAQTLDRPTEMAFGHRQEQWADVIRQIIRYAVRASVRAGGTLDAALVDDDGVEVLTVDGEPMRVDVEWPDLTEHSVKDIVEAIAEADGTGKLPAEWVTRLLLQALGVDDVEQVVDDFLDQVQQASDEREAEAAATEALAEAVRQLAGAGVDG